MRNERLGWLLTKAAEIASAMIAVIAGIMLVGVEGGLKADLMSIPESLGYAAGCVLTGLIGILGVVWFGEDIG